MIFFYIIARRKGKSLRSHGCVSQDAFDTLDFSSKSNTIWLQSSDPEVVFDLLLLHERVIDLLAHTNDADLFDHINSEWIRVLRVWHKRYLTEGILACLYHFVEDFEIDGEDSEANSDDSYEDSYEDSVEEVEEVEEVEAEIADEGSDEDNHEDDHEKE
jgi:hypothetical protein